MSTTIQRSNYYGPLEPAKLQLLEQTLGEDLPGEYRQFLSQHNGGIPVPHCFEVPGDEEYNGEPAERLFACFFAAHDQPWNDDTLEGSFGFPLQEAWQDFANEAPDSQAIPIGKDVNGSYICINYTGDDKGTVCFYDHEYEILRPLAESLQTFLSTLHACKEN